MSDPIIETLQERFALPSFLPGQREVIEHLLDRRSAAAVFPTGGGKSLCYQLTSLMLPGLTLVVSPLIALMKDQIDGLLARGIQAARMDSSLTREEYMEVVAKLRSGDLRLLYVAPERFNNERFREMMNRAQISLLAIDEAHCISEWGHNFRPDYLKLAGYAETLGAERVLALTATATPPVLADICARFSITDEAAIRTPFYRKNLELRHRTGTAAQREAWLIKTVAEQQPGPTIVYVTQQITAQRVAENIRAKTNRDARHYHAGLKSDVRAATQDWFMQSDDGIVVATIAFGMGIDKSNIRNVLHYNPPKSLENYAQEIGRAGRDRLPSLCESFLVPDDLNIIENFIYGDTPSRESISGLLKELLAGADNERVEYSLYTMSRAHDLRPLVLRTLLTRLELRGVIKGGTPSYSSYEFKPLTDSTAMLARFEGEQREFTKKVLSCASKRKTWFDMDVDAAAQKTRRSRRDVLARLDDLDAYGLMELKVGGVRNPYTVIQRPPDPDELVDALYEEAEQREGSEIGRIGEVLSLITAIECQVGMLNAHFGEKLAEPCGHCGVCNGAPTPTLPDREFVPISARKWEALLELRDSSSSSGALQQPRSLARFACGLTSPRLSRARLAKHALFGSLRDVPFGMVLARAGAIGT
ncbi:MAG: ATP-dependent DNA helicase RecQ [Bradymonadia bacterium]